MFFFKLGPGATKTQAFPHTSLKPTNVGSDKVWLHFLERLKSTADHDFYPYDLPY